MKKIPFSIIEIAKLLVDHGADVYAKAYDSEWTPLSVASSTKGKFYEWNCHNDDILLQLGNLFHLSQFCSAKISGKQNGFHGLAPHLLALSHDLFCKQFQ